MGGADAVLRDFAGDEKREDAAPEGNLGASARFSKFVLRRGNLLTNFEKQRALANICS
jgi:hypothetical protein